MDEMTDSELEMLINAAMNAAPIIQKKEQPKIEDLVVKERTEPTKYRVRFHNITASFGDPWQVYSIEKNRSYREALSRFVDKTSYTTICNNQKYTASFRIEDNKDDDESFYLYIYAPLTEEQILSLVNNAIGEEPSLLQSGSFQTIQGIELAACN